jgi:hypothetical protein
MDDHGRRCSDDDHSDCRGPAVVECDERDRQQANGGMVRACPVAGRKTVASDTAVGIV